MMIPRRTLLGMGLLGAAAAISVGLVCTPTTANPGVQARIGAAAPAFALTDTNGKSVSLADFKGKTVVLEWTNHDCPYVRKHYGGNNMQALQKKWTAQGVVWLTVISSAPGKQGYVTGEQEKKYLEEKHAAPSNVLFDPQGTLGQLYGAKTTPHMFVIDPKGDIVYAGAIDDKRSTRIEDAKTANNYVRVALNEAMAGKPVTTPNTTPYGCTVKY
jgi:peroxiredoxin